MKHPFTKNNFDLVRLFLAFTVLLFHASILTQAPELKILENLFNADFAVKGFFVISGFLVMKSYLASPAASTYFSKRFFRIYPAYFTTIIFCLFIGLIATSLDIKDFLFDHGTIKYFFLNSIFLNFLAPNLPSVFSLNPHQAMDGSLWTIKVEICLYFCIPIIAFLYRKVGEYWATLILFSTSIFWSIYFILDFDGVLGNELARQFPGQLSYFVLGSLLSQKYNLLKYLLAITIISGTLYYSSNSVLGKIVLEPIYYASSVIFLCTQAYKKINLRKVGEISYGVYLYHFPIIQLLIYLNIFRYDWRLGIVLSVTLTFICAILSWHLIEFKFIKKVTN